MNSSLDVLSESLDLKIEVLKEIEEYNKKQQAAFEKGNPDIESFDKAIDEKAGLIERLEKLDEGFEALYSKLSDEIKNNREKYADKIKVLQYKIGIVTELSMSVQASEARNKQLVEQYFVKERQNVKNSRVGSRVAYGYYKSMSGAEVVGPQFMDSKK